jgi:RNA-binding protein YhbY
MTSPFILFLCTLIILLTTCKSFLFRQFKIPVSSSCHFAQQDETQSTSESRWTNPDYSEVELLTFWKSVEPLMTVGASGVTPTLINALNHYSDHRNLVKVKVASDKFDSWNITQKFLEDPVLNQKVQLLEVRKRGFLVKRLVMLDDKPKRKRREDFSQEGEEEGENEQRKNGFSVMRERRTSSGGERRDSNTSNRTPQVQKKEITEEVPATGAIRRMREAKKESLASNGPFTGSARKSGPSFTSSGSRSSSARKSAPARFGRSTAGR